jgi:hypothetical protein
MRIGKQRHTAVGAAHAGQVRQATLRNAADRAVDGSRGAKTLLRGRRNKTTMRYGLHCGAWTR